MKISFTALRMFIVGTLLATLHIGSFTLQPAIAITDIQDRSNDKQMLLEGTNYLQQPASYTDDYTYSFNDINLNLNRSNTAEQNLSKNIGNSSMSAVSEATYETYFMEHPVKGLLLCSTDPNASLLCDPVDTSETSSPDQVQDQEPALEPIVITESQFMELIPETPQIIMDKNGFGLKNGHTNFYASHYKPQTATTTIFGSNVQITATPISFQWDYGDGTTFESQYPGYPQTEFNEETDASHQYQDTGNYTATLTTVFLGSYSVNGGPAQAIASTVALDSQAMPVQIYKAETRNVYESCLENPNAWGCDIP